MERTLRLQRAVILYLSLGMNASRLHLVCPGKALYLPLSKHVLLKDGARKLNLPRPSCRGGLQIDGDHQPLLARWAEDKPR